MSEQQGRISWHQQLMGLTFASPFLIGFCSFMLIPLITSLYLSFSDYPMLRSAMPIGTYNYVTLLHDPVFWKALYNTFVYAIFSVPFSLTVSVLLAVLLNAKARGKALWQTIIFLPTLVPGVAAAMLWMWLLNGKDGVFNVMLRSVSGWIGDFFGLFGASAATVQSWHLWIPPDWIGTAFWVKPTLILMGFWGVGYTVIIFLAGLQDIPTELYEAAEIDGASGFKKFWHVTIPTISPVIFFNLIMGIIGSWSVFDTPYVLTGGGGVDRSAYFYSMYVFDTAMLNFQMGMASALAYVQLFIILILTALLFWSSKKWVHYR
jgi:multiple sugar transport system permease protein